MHLLATEPGIDRRRVGSGRSRPDARATSSCCRAPTPRSRCSPRRRRSAARDDPAAPSLRLAPVLRLGHNFSVDLYMEMVARARLVVARLLGGSAYWPYGVERLVETCRERGIPLALLPGDDKPDPELARLSTLPPRGVPPAVALSRRGRPGATPRISCATPPSLIGDARRGHGREPAPLLRAGLYWPGEAHAEPRRHRRRMARRCWASYRSCSTGRWSSRGTRRRSMRWSQALTARRLRPLPVFVQSLKDGEAAALLADGLRRPPAGRDPQRDRLLAGGGGRRRPARAPIARSCRWYSPAATRNRGAPAPAASARAIWR